jgi:hypothetical protein
MGAVQDGGEDVRLIDADYITEGRVSNDSVVIAAKCAPTIDAIPVEWLKGQIAEAPDSLWASLIKSVMNQWQKGQEAR